MDLIGAVSCSYYDMNQGKRLKTFMIAVDKRNWLSRLFSGKKISKMMVAKVQEDGEIILISAPNPNMITAHDEYYI